MEAKKLSDSDFPPFIKWGSFKSQNQNKPDVLELQVAELETFETEYSVNIRVLQKEGNKWNEKILPLKSLESVNSILLKEWEKNARKDIITVGRKFLLKTWLGKSKRSDHTIRRFVLKF